MKPQNIQFKYSKHTTFKSNAIMIKTTFSQTKKTTVQELISLNNQVQWTMCELDTDDDINLSAALLILSDDETNRANRFHFNKHRERFIRGRAFLRTVVASRLNIEPKALVLSKNEFDKPFVAGNPIHFNLSHSSATAVLVISEKQPIGIDIEFVDRKIEVLELGRTVFTKSEVALLENTLENTPENNAKKLFFKFWTAKEAYLKMLGTGLSLEPKKLQLGFDGDMPNSCSSEGRPSCKITYITLADKKTICCIAEPQ